EAGDRAAEELAPKLMTAGIECFRVQFPRGMDANAYALKVQPPHKSLELVIRNAVWMGKGLAPRRDEAAPVVQIEPPPAPEPANAAPAVEGPATVTVIEATAAIAAAEVVTLPPAAPMPAPTPVPATAPASPVPPPPRPALPYERRGADL